MASNGAVVKALDLFSVCLAYLGDKAMECIHASGQRGKTYESRDVQWVVTVPAIWEPTAKEFMREAAYKVRKEPFQRVVHLRHKSKFKLILDKHNPGSR